MATTKADLASKIQELHTLASSLPAGASKDSITGMLGDLRAAAAAGLNDDGSTSSVAIPNMGMRVPQKVAGDGLAACC